MKQSYSLVLAMTVATVAGIATAACGSDVVSDSAGMSSSLAGDGEYLALDGKYPGQPPQPPAAPDLEKPTVSDLADRVNTTLDTEIDGRSKVGWLEYADRDPHLVDRFVEAAVTSKVEIEITGVREPVSATLQADARVTRGDLPAEDAVVDFVAEGGQWKISHRFACGVIRGAGLDSAACQDI